MYCFFVSARSIYRDLAVMKNNIPGDHSEEVTPVPISNTEVKGLSGDGTVALGHGRVARCRDLSSAGLGRIARAPFLFMTASLKQACRVSDLPLRT